VIGKEANIELLYGEGQYEILDTRGSLFDKIVAFDDRVILQQMRKLTLSGKRLLDFGCGKGQFLHWALDYGWQGQGIETGKKRAEFGQNVYGLKINTLEYHGGLIDGGLFDAITLFHVLEHLRNPKAVMEELVKSNLKDGGLLVIEVPNFGSLQSKIAGKYWLHLVLRFTFPTFRRAVL
jgi:2-polyprenyl-3-methyl-5-hydroxy-6-metoxy-1,4-benzoquinol methylase